MGATYLIVAFLSGVLLGAGLCLLCFRSKIRFYKKYIEERLSRDLRDERFLADAVGIRQTPQR